MEHRITFSLVYIAKTILKLVSTALSAGLQCKFFIGQPADWMCIVLISKAIHPYEHQHQFILLTGFHKILRLSISDSFTLLTGSHKLLSLRVSDSYRLKVLFNEPPCIVPRIISQERLVSLPSLPAIMHLHYPPDQLVYSTCSLLQEQSYQTTAAISTFSSSCLATFQALWPAATHKTCHSLAFAGQLWPLPLYLFSPLPFSRNSSDPAEDQLGVCLIQQGR